MARVLAWPTAQPQTCRWHEPVRTREKSAYSFYGCAHLLQYAWLHVGLKTKQARSGSAYSLCLYIPNTLLALSEHWYNNVKEKWKSENESKPVEKTKHESTQLDMFVARRLKVAASL